MADYQTAELVVLVALLVPLTVMVWFTYTEWREYRRLRSIVFNNLDDALACGQFDAGGHCNGMTDLELAIDLCCYAANCEDFNSMLLVTHVRQWRETTLSGVYA